MIKRAFSRDLYRPTQVIENSDGTFTPTVAVTGSNVLEREIDREILDGFRSITKTAPSNARGVIVAIRTFGATGTFEPGEGLEFWTRSRSGATENLVAIKEEPSTSGNYRRGHQWGFGTDLGDANFETGEMKMTSVLPQDQINVRLSITGTFEPGEGFDVTLEFIWVV